MWESNKQSFTFFLVGLAILSGVWYFVRDNDPELAKKILAVGFCFLLFGAGLISYYLARKGDS